MTSHIPGNMLLRTGDPDPDLGNRSGVPFYPQRPDDRLQPLKMPSGLFYCWTILARPSKK